MKKNQKVTILAIDLTSFGIKPLNNWIRREEKKRLSEIEMVKDKIMEDQHVSWKNRLEELTVKEVRTVGGLIRAYPYRFTHKWRINRYKHLLGLGRPYVAQLKVKLVGLGLTPDDWPALAEHYELLEKLSKKVILQLPLTEVFAGNTFDGQHLAAYLRCLLGELHMKTVKDFIIIDPNEPAINPYASRFVWSHHRILVALRQKLATKGFTARDGAFLKWNPDVDSTAKAMKRLEKYKLTPAVRKTIAKIAVAERWVV